MLSIIVPYADIIILTKSVNPRASEPSNIQKIIQEIDRSKKVIIKEKIMDAVAFALKIAEKDDLICVTGSLFTVGEAKNYF